MHKVFKKRPISNLPVNIRQMHRIPTSEMEVTAIFKIENRLLPQKLLSYHHDIWSPSANKQPSCKKGSKPQIQKSKMVAAAMLKIEIRL
jgi:hypothetical protein